MCYRKGKLVLVQQGVTSAVLFINEVHCGASEDTGIFINYNSIYPSSLRGFWGFGECGLLVIQKLDKITTASEQLREKGYYNHWNQKDLDDVVTWRHK